jgi:hypothetical protein
MRRRHVIEPKYCTLCFCTTKHAVKPETYTCIRCGAEKHPVSRITIARPELLAAGE